ncbi:NmrA family NAD(P)-binding protein [Pedobacter sp. ISL-68]|uniref:NmrA family NAD(P)-binding protein n=1 Tax=unclassified Pedobacter TaxID=2628915 RepID=UPI001BE7C36D|nr:MULTISPECIES: NmrA family NAD(P)-binding protein [unclassified Pedobacter]MBT2560077.1 NmrA family NAD(P)-binding protein [Pedobacter sp. ISL-64]MBT2589056.1 NmrA family NAD(P)-binding protein [Pedobacter sp. ISL-68]
MKNQVLITGATGNTGGHAVKYLLEQGVPVRALVHKLDGRSDALVALGVEVVLGDLSDLESVSAAMKDISSAFFVYPITQPGIIEATAYFAQAAAENGVAHIVNLSQFGAHRHVRSHGAQNHWIAERVFERSGVPVTQLRPTLFAEWFLYQSTMISSQRKFFLPFGDARYAPIATEDIGRVVAAILAEPAPHAGKSYDLFGPKILNMAEIAAIFSEQLESTVTYVPIDTDTFVGIVKTAMNAGPYFLQHVTSLGQDLKEGRAAGMNDLVETLTGQKPMEISEFIHKNKAAFA